MDQDTVALMLGTYSVNRAHRLADYIAESEPDIPVSVRIDVHSPVRADVSVVALCEDVTEKQLRAIVSPSLARLLP